MVHRVASWALLKPEIHSSPYRHGTGKSSLSSRWLRVPYRVYAAAVYIQVMYIGPVYIYTGHEIPVITSNLRLNPNVIPRSIVKQSHQVSKGSPRNYRIKLMEFIRLTGQAGINNQSINQSINQSFIWRIVTYNLIPKDTSQTCTVGNTHIHTIH